MLGKKLVSTVGVTEVHPDGVQFNDGSAISTRTVVWGGGESGSAVAQAAGPSPGRGGRLDVRPDLTVAGYPGTYAVGDVANIPYGDDAAALPQLGSVAQQSGKWAAQNILRELHGNPTEPFVYKDKGIMAMIGRNAAVAEVGKHHHQVEGPVAFAAWLGVHAMLLSGVHSKIDAFLSWGWDYFDRDHAPPSRHRRTRNGLPGPTTARTCRTSCWTGPRPRAPAPALKPLEAAGTQDMASRAENRVVLSAVPMDCRGCRRHGPTVIHSRRTPSLSAGAAHSARGPRTAGRFGRLGQ
jgi:hypothetical protein